MIHALSLKYCTHAHTPEMWINKCSQIFGIFCGSHLANTFIFLGDFVQGVAGVMSSETFEWAKQMMPKRLSLYGKEFYTLAKLDNKK